MNLDDYTIEAAAEAFRTRQRMGIRLEIATPGIVYAYHDGVLLWHEIVLDPEDAGQMIWAMVRAITSAAAEIVIIRAKQPANTEEV